MLGLQTQAQINVCDSISYSTTSTINYPLIISGNTQGVSNIVDSITWIWQVCNSTTCYSGTGQNASFGQVSTTDTLKVCYDVIIIDWNGITYTCSSCNSLVYNHNSYQWESISIRPLGINELKTDFIDNGKTYDLMGKEVFKTHKGIIYIKNGKKFIK